MEKYILIPVDGKPHFVELDENDLLNEIKKHLDCEYIETATLGHRRILIVDENGKLNGKPFNNFASLLYASFSYDFIVGNALVAAYGLRDGETDLVPLPPDEERVMCSLLGIDLEEESSG